MKKPKILIVDDHDGFRDSLINSPILKSKYSLLEADTGEKALEIIKINLDIDCILLDYDFRKFGTSKNISGIDVLNHLKDFAPHIPIIMMSGITEGRGNVAIESIKRHAIDFLDKPFQIKSLIEKLDSILRINEDSIKSREAQEILSSFGFISKSKIMSEVANEIIKAAKNDLNIMISGETGTGKTMIARIIHLLSSRSKNKYEEIPCGILSSDVNSFRSQLFGHVKGAFTNAFQNKKGVFELVENGTLVLDDVTTMPMEVQKGLLQAIENRFFSRFGDESSKIKFDARVISTTNQNINESINDKSFRSDLKYRLCGEFINIPPLRKRTEDIPLIIEFFLKTNNNEKFKNMTIASEALSLLERQPWIGNVRQLLYVISRAAYHENNNVISLSTIKSELLKEYDLDFDNYDLLFDINIDDLESKIDILRRKVIIEELRKSNGNLSEVARNLGYSNHSSIQYWIRQYGIDVKDYKK